MDRTTANYTAILNPGSRRVFQNVNPPTVPNGTQIDATYETNQQEELLALIEGSGLAPNAALQAQVLQGVRRLTGGTVRTLVQSVAGSAVTLTADNAGVVAVDATAGGMTITLPAVAAANGAVATVATANSLAFTFVRIDTTPNWVVVVPAGSDTAVPAGTLSVPVGLPLSLLGDGVSKWLAVQATGFTGQWVAFTASGTFTVPFGISRVRALVIGGGGAGGTGGTWPGGGGGAGGQARKLVTGLSAGASVAVTIGAGGTPNGSAGNGGAGGTTSFGSYLSATGGAGGGGAANPGAGGAGGAGVGGDLNFGGSYGTDGITAAGRGGDGGGPGNGRGVTGTSLSPIAATGYGGGGGGGCLSGAGGAGAGGLVLVEY